MYFCFRTNNCCFILFFFFFNDTATTEIYTLSLHDALPIGGAVALGLYASIAYTPWLAPVRSEEHTSDLQSRPHLVCRLLLEKNKHTTLFFHDKYAKMLNEVMVQYDRLS